uniref:Uncharacterized protein n=1 Tax=viral metagenome TaxID=1070528 RepID=A0A6C0H584_9ZZZZ
MSSPLSVLIIEKFGCIKPLQIKDFKENELFKKCGFKSENNFQKETSWKINNITISVYGKKIGKSDDAINKYDFPPPIDNTLFYGNCVLVAFDNTANSFIDLKLQDWKLYYDKLFDGFEDITSDNDDDDDDDDDYEDDTNFNNNDEIFIQNQLDEDDYL